MSGFVDKIEENLIALLLALMTIISFANVIARYGFNSNILWALEFSLYCFAWLVLLGASYAVKKNAHLGVDVLINLFSEPVRRIFGLVAVASCIVFSFLLLKGAWDYWSIFANLPPTEGRWFPTGFVEKFRGQGWYETNDIPVPGFMKFIEDVFNDGDEYEKIPRLIPYFVLPVSMALLLYRYVQAAVAIWVGKADRLIVSHEAEEDVANARLSDEG
ncbi:TRAP transporter small permease [uncultured Litoreibacter sp.]|uniref:TRAP transporter small permease n=1 Tax=uncultured Litoreibacter sp. TaxID=1392394 RepID=UPI00261311D0|nr:TRAP transporter small permease [uncultured Litoreibacter sp.]